MPSPELLIILLFLGVAIASLLSGYPVAFGLGGAGLLLLAVLASALHLVSVQYESRRLFAELDRAVASQIGRMSHVM